MTALLLIFYLLLSKYLSVDYLCAALVWKEADLKRLRKAKIQQEIQDMEASLRRAKVEASRADGVSWGMGEDAIEDNEVCITDFYLCIIISF